MPITDHDGTISVTGESVLMVRDVTRLHFWRSQANMKIQFNMTPRDGWNIKAFNAMYDIPAERRVKSWQEIFQITDDVIKGIRTEAKEVQS